ncbi:MAG: chemotaxis protein CheW [Mastigocoleus sp. MO_167.B18]|nr:chemotaxis protein CheW [Mastigocoleus sp. MO_167.B18]
MDSKHKFLSFNLGNIDTAVILLEDITEVVPISLTEICSVPQMHNYILGIYNWRGEMLWIIDLEEMLGYTSVIQEAPLISKMMVIVVQAEGKYLGLIVRKLIDIYWLDTDLMKSPDPQLFKSDIIPRLHGYFIDESENIIISLDANAIIKSPAWEIYS